MPSVHDWYFALCCVCIRRIASPDKINIHKIPLAMANAKSKFKFKLFSLAVVIVGCTQIYFEFKFNNTRPNQPKKKRRRAKLNCIWMNMFSVHCSVRAKWHKWWFSQSKSSMRLTGYRVRWRSIIIIAIANEDFSFGFNLFGFGFHICAIFRLNRATVAALLFARTPYTQPANGFDEKLIVFTF